ncbi:hypothetical protein OH77DRAFT_1451415 [Trametes cingulata]|nr:hypothetical protein OH77DRAFT_1451415 [Trametes cingulata]
MSFSSLPSEVIELVLIYAAAASPESLAAFSQTCRAYKELVYGASDNHLWREIFLTTFDDPRESGGGPGWYEANAHKASTPKTAATFDWGGEYRTRIWAARYIHRETEPPAEGGKNPYDTSNHPDTIRANARAMDALVSVVQTAAPCPPSIVFSFLQTGEGSNTTLTPGVTYPTFPPLPQALLASSSSITAVTPADGSGRTLSQTLGARNIAWLQAVLARGYPPSLVARFAGDSWDGGLAGQYLDEDEFREMQSAGRMIACTGFRPTPPALAFVGPFAVDPKADSPPQEERYMSEERQLKRARRLARMRVYNMRYLARERHWGPYLPCVEKKARVLKVQVEDDELLQPILALFRVPEHAHAHDDDDEIDDELGDGHDHEHPHHHHHEDEDEDEDGEGDDADAADEEDADGTAEANDMILGAEMPVQQPQPSAQPSPPSPEQLRADWAYLAAVRMVVEANLRETFVDEDLSGLLSLDGLRPGSAPWDASQYKASLPVDGEGDGGDGKGKEKMGDGEVEGWDWAGVTGVWKRCVCWMDYRDLILHNLSGEFEDPHLAEAVRIIAMHLRVASYSRCAVPGYEHLPNIHVVGETTGASITGQPRRIKGTVGIIADGSVRWTLQFSSVEGGDANEWVSEGVQVGGVASAMGVLGMWTGANHERMDPLGPCWAWKVG